MSSIYSYTEYRDFINDALLRKRSQNPSFSVRAMAAHLSIGSGTLSRILHGTRNIGPTLLPAITEFLGLKAREAEYFSLLVRFSRSANPGKKRKFYEQMLRMRAGSRPVIAEEHYQIFERRPCLALHQLLRTVSDCADCAQLGAMLVPRVSAAGVRKAIDLLERTGLIRKNEHGGYSPLDTSLTTGETWRGMAIHGFQRESARLAAEALDRFPKEERDFSTLTVGLSAANFVAAREILRKARQDLLSLDEKETCPDRVYQMNFQLFPLSRPLGAERGQP
jgi:uncharacterized protein (TIGR02147 family)